MFEYEVTAPFVSHSPTVEGPEPAVLLVNPASDLSRTAVLSIHMNDPTHDTPGCCIPGVGVRPGTTMLYGLTVSLVA